jgi:hypothetical protein
LEILSGWGLNWEFFPVGDLIGNSFRLGIELGILSGWGLNWEFFPVGDLIGNSFRLRIE